MSSATLEAKLRLEISGLQANLAKADGELKRFQDGVRERSRSGADGVRQLTRAHEELARKIENSTALFAPKAVNPWTTASAGARQYAQVVTQEVVPALKQQATAAAATPWQPRTGESLDTNRLLAQQALRDRVSAQSGMAGRGGGAGMRNLGMISMQAQDIAVQLQMGTRASVVLAQQGSQLLSVFGSGGAIAGGVVAIGGALYMMGEKGREAFETAAEEGRAFAEQLRATLSSGGLADVTKGIGDVDERLRSLNAQMQGMMLSSGFTDQLASYFGGPSIQQKAAQLNADITAAREAQAQLGTRLVDLSAQELEISQLKARGETEKADAMEREVALAREIARINAMQVQGPQRAQLIEDARARSLNAAAAEKLLKAQAEIKRLDAEIKDAALEALTPAQRQLELARQQQAVFDSMAVKGGLFHTQNIAGLQAWADKLRQVGDVSKLEEVLAMQSKALDLQRQMDALDDDDRAATSAARDRAEEAQGKADFEKLSRTQQIAALQRQIAGESGKEQFAQDMSAPRAMYEAQLRRLDLQRQLNALLQEESRATRDAQEKREDAAAQQIRQHEAMRQFVSRLQETEARAGGRDKMADRISQQRQQEEQAKQYAAEMGIGYEKALSLVKQLDDAEQRLARRKMGGGAGEDGGARKIYHTGRFINSFSGLRDWDGMQRRGPMEFGPGLSGKGGRLTDPSQYGLTEHATRNADNQDARGKTQSSVENLLREQNALLAKVFYGTTAG